MKFLGKNGKKNMAQDEAVEDISTVHPEDLSERPPFEDMDDEVPVELFADDAQGKPKGFLSRILSKLKKDKGENTSDDLNDGNGDNELTLDKQNENEAPDAVKAGGLKEKLASLFGKKPKPGQDEETPVEMNAAGLAKIEGGQEAEYEFDTQQTLKILKKNVILGMLWDSTRPGESVKSQAKAVSGDEINYTLAANFRDANQIGFSDGSNGIKPGFKAGVTCFDPQQMGDSWVGAFRIGENADIWWVVAHRNGQVYEDQLLRDADEARALFLENMEAPDWQRRIAPDYWEIGGTEDFRIQDVLKPSMGIALKAVNPIKTYLPRIIAASVLVIVGIVAYVMYQSHLEDLKIQEEMLQKERAASVRVAPSDYPYFDTPSVVQFINECTPRIDYSMRFVPGWRQDLVTCKFDEAKKNGMILTGWTNIGGTVPWLTAYFGPNEARPTITLDGMSATYGINIYFGVQTEVLPEPWEEERIEKVLRRRLQTTGVRLSLDSQVERTTPEQRAKMRSPIFNFHQVSFQTSGAIADYARLFDDIPAIVPVEVVYDINSHVWNVKFRIYHTPILPL